MQSEHSIFIVDDEVGYDKLRAEADEMEGDSEEDEDEEDGEEEEEELETA